MAIGLLVPRIVAGALFAGWIHVLDGRDAGAGMTTSSTAGRVGAWPAVR